MNIYSLIKWYRRIENPRIRLLGILALHLTKRRYLNMAFDPVLACNLRCKMCYFCDPEARKELHGTFSVDDIDAIAKSLFHRVLRLQIGCGAEPTVFARLSDLVDTAARYGIPNISLTTNGQLLTQELLEELLEKGLNELIISAHGLSKEVYEEMMPQARFERFQQLLVAIGICKERNPQLKVRLNYTINEDNIDDLKRIPDLFSDMRPDVIQLRPIQQIGDTAYSNFSKEQLIRKYDACIQPVVRFCEQHHITCLYPDRDNLSTIDTRSEDISHANTFVEMLPYFQLAPFEGWKEKIDPYKETFEDYCHRTHRVRRMFRCLFGLVDDEREEGRTKALNYQIK